MIAIGSEHEANVMESPNSPPVIRRKIGLVLMLHHEPRHHAA